MKQTQQYKGCTIRIEQDQDAKSPRTWSNLGTMACIHRRYSLGDQQFQTTQALVASIPPGAIRLPLYLYDHSGLSMQTRPYSCPWDSGQVGWIWVSRQAVLKEYGWKVLTAKRRAQVEAYLVGEVKAYDAYLQGNAYGYVAEGPQGEDIGSCWGFFDTGTCAEGKNIEMAYMLEQAQGEIDAWLMDRAEQAEQMQALLG